MKTIKHKDCVLVLEYSKKHEIPFIILDSSMPSVDCYSKEVGFKGLVVRVSDGFPDNDFNLWFIQEKPDTEFTKDSKLVTLQSVPSELIDTILAIKVGFIDEFTKLVLKIKQEQQDIKTENKQKSDEELINNWNNFLGVI